MNYQTSATGDRESMLPTINMSYPTVLPSAPSTVVTVPVQLLQQPSPSNKSQFLITFGTLLLIASSAALLLGIIVFGSMPFGILTTFILIDCVIYIPVGAACIYNGLDINRRRGIAAMGIFSFIGLSCCCTALTLSITEMDVDCYRDSKGEIVNTYWNWRCFGTFDNNVVLIAFATTAGLQIFIGLVISVYCCWQCCFWCSCLSPPSVVQVPIQVSVPVQPQPQMVQHYSVGYPPSAQPPDYNFIAHQQPNDSPATYQKE